MQRDLALGSPPPSEVVDVDEHAAVAQVLELLLRYAIAVPRAEPVEPDLAQPGGPSRSPLETPLNTQTKSSVRNCDSRARSAAISAGAASR